MTRTRKGTSPPQPGAVAVPAAKIRIPKISALPRQRLTALVPSLWEQRLLLVVAPAGSGKTTLAAQIAAAAEAPVAWCSAQRSYADESAFLEQLERSFRLAIPELMAGWGTIEEAAAALEELEPLGRRALLVVDDFHVLQSTPAEETLERLLEYAPAEVAVLVASRTRPGFNLSRLRVSGSVVELGPDDLRFRSWEVERLFLEHYGDPLPPEELALLAQRTEGWAAGLQLFHLATRGKPPSERRATLAALRARWKAAREYLADNVLHDLPPVLREFLIRTSVLTVLSGKLCDALLERKGSEELLEELERRQIFTTVLDDEGRFRYHEVLRSQLEAIFVDGSGDEEARAHFRRAGELLEADGALPDALRAYSRAEDSEAVRRLLGKSGEELVDGRVAWIDLLPPSLVDDDPWLQLARARHERAAGRLDRAIAAYGDAEKSFGRAAAAELCRRERLALAAWVEPAFVPSSDEWLGLLRAATIRDPVAARRKSVRIEGPGARLAGGLAALLAGQLEDALALLAAAEQDPEATATVSAAAHLGSAVAMLLSGDDVKGAVEADLAAEEAERIGLAWLARTGRAALALSGREDGRDEAAAARAVAQREGDAWGTALAAFLEGWGALRAGTRADGALEEAVLEFRRLGATVLESWARGAYALELARRDAPTARDEAAQAELTARSAGVRAALGCTYLALAELQGHGGAEYRALAAGLAAEFSLDLPGFAAGGELSTEPPVEVRCFGGFGMYVDGAPIELGAAKPRTRQLLRLLAINAGRPVHREVLMAGLWPEADRETATRNLHVAISSLRHALEPGVARGASSMIVRDGDAYRLTLTAGSRVDLVEFDEALALARSRRTSAEKTVEAYTRALDLYAGELLPEDGPAEWVVNERDRRRDEFSEAAHAVALAHVERGDPVAAAVACERGLHADQYNDALWRLCATAYEQAGDAAAAARARQKYDRILVDLGVPTDALRA